MYAFVNIPGELGRKIRQYCAESVREPDDLIRELLQDFAEKLMLEAPEPVDEGKGLDKMVAVYRRMRATCKEINKLAEDEVDKINVDMKKIHNVLLDKLNKDGVESMRTKHGTFYKQEDFRPSCHDWVSFYQWIKEEDTFEFLERRVTKSAIEAYVAEHKELPPGISAHREYKVVVRRS